MAMNALVNIIFNLCLKYKNINQERTCQTNYVNCIIGYNGQWNQATLNKCIKEKQNAN